MNAPLPSFVTAEAGWNLMEVRSTHLGRDSHILCGMGFSVGA
jgi:hypothetical protein